MILGFLAALATTGRAAPPPPIAEPDELARPVDGYDLGTPYQLWRWWIEAQKGAVTEALLAEPERLEGELAFGEAFLRFTKHNDFGHFLTGEIRVYCRAAQPRGFVPGTCHYRLRRAYVPHDAGAHGEDNPVSRWMRQSFDAPRLASHLRASGFAPDTDWWRADRARMFSALPSPIPMLTENATIVRLDSRDCPAMANAIAALERERLDWRLDFSGIGEDGHFQAPSPHQVTANYTIRIRVPGGIADIEARYGALHDRLGPVLEAADACERERAT